MFWPLTPFPSRAHEKRKGAPFRISPRNPHSVFPLCPQEPSSSNGRKESKSKSIFYQGALIPNPLCFPAGKARVGAGWEPEAKPGRGDGSRVDKVPQGREKLMTNGLTGSRAPGLHYTAAMGGKAREGDGSNLCSDQPQNWPPRQDILVATVK